MSEARIAIVLKGYPRLSETFIAQEILALERRGLALTIWSLRRPTDEARHPMHAAIAAPVAYLPEYLRDAPLRVLRALARAARRSRFPRLVAQFARDLARDPSPSRIRRFGQALVLAESLPDAVTHLHAHFLHTPASVARYAAILTGRGWSFSAHAKDIWTTPDWELAEKLSDAEWGVSCTRDGLGRLRGIAGASMGGQRASLPPLRERDARALSRKRGAPYPEGALPSSDPLSCDDRPPPQEGRGGHVRISGTARDIADRRAWKPRCGNREDLASDHVALAYHGLDLTRFPEPPAARPARDGADAGDPIRILCVGRLVAKKGHDDLIDALAALPPSLNWHLDLIGGGELRSVLKADVAARCLTERITFHGALAQPAVIAAMQAADLFVLPTKPAPSGDRDGLPNVLMEAASQGLPILATAFAGTPEFIIDGREGVLVAPGDPAALSAAIRRLARDPAERRRLSAAARTRLVRDFSLDAGIDLIAGRLSASAGIALGRPPQTQAAEGCACGC